MENLKKKKTITISEEEYNHLIRLAHYVSNWGKAYWICDCGCYNPIGYRCINCDSSQKRN